MKRVTKKYMLPTIICIVLVVVLFYAGISTLSNIGNIRPSLFYDKATSATSVIQISAGDSMSFALLENGQLWGWGRHSLGYEPDWHQLSHSTPVLIMEDVIYVSAGNFHVAAITSDNVLWSYLLGFALPKIHIIKKLTICGSWV